MLKVTTSQGGVSPHITVEGRLAGPWVDELDRCWHEVTAREVGHIVVDLTGITYVDATGKELLKRMCRHGAELKASGCLTKCIVDEIAKEER